MHVGREKCILRRLNGRADYEGEISCTVVLGEQKQTVSAVSSIPSSMDGEKRESGVVFNETVNLYAGEGGEGEGLREVVEEN